MRPVLVSVFFHCILTITLFSYWAGFALLVVNKVLYNDLPGYTIGRICIWEYVALVIAALLARVLILRWGDVKIQKVEGQEKLTMNPKYGYYFLGYLLIALGVGIWQFYLFSQKF